MARECLLCGDFESEHEADEKGDRFLGRCRARNYYGPGSNDYVQCDCPGLELAPDVKRESELE